jgi:hypothetical protein
MMISRFEKAKKSPFKHFLDSGDSEHLTKVILEWRNFKTEIAYLGRSRNLRIQS